MRETKIGEVANLIQGGVYYIIVQQPLNGSTGLDPSVYRPFLLLIVI